MLLLVCASVCVVLAACNHPREEGKVTYLVTVTSAQGVSLTEVKAQWLKEGEPASDEIALDGQGKAYAELPAGEYTVTLKGVPEGYTFQEAKVTADSREASISVVAQTTAVTISVRVPASMPETQSVLRDISAQLFKGETAVGVARELSATGVAQISVPRDNQTYKVKLLNLPDYLDYPETTVVTSGATAIATIQTVPAKIEYTVRIETGENLDGATVTFFKDGQAVEGATNLPVQDKTVKANLTAGEYTAKFSSPDAGLIADEVSLTFTAEGREAKITVTLSKYTITLEKPSNLSAAYTDLKVTLIKDGAATGYYANANAEGVAAIHAPRGKYGIKVEDANGAQIGHLPVNLTETADEAEVKLAVILPVEIQEGNPERGEPDINLADINAEGRYFINVEVTPYPDWLGEPGGEAYCEFSLTFGGEARIYEVAWECPNTCMLDVLDLGKGIRSGDSLKFLLTENSNSANFSLDFTTETDIPEGGAELGYLVTVTSSAAPEQGKERIYPLELKEGENTVDATWKEAWFSVPADYPSHQLTFTGNITVQYITDGMENTLGNGKYLLGNGWSSGMLHVMTLNDPIAFTLTEKIEEGTAPQAAVEIVADTLYEHTFSGYSDYYYKFTPDENVAYDIIGAGDNAGNFTYISVYEGLSTDNCIGTSNENRLYLTSGTEYLLVLARGDGSMGFKIIKHTPESGDKELPIEMSNTGETANEISVATRETFYKFTVTADSLTEDGLILIDFVAKENSATLECKFYDTAFGGEPVFRTDTQGDEKFWWATHIELDGFAADSILYFTVKGSGEVEYELYINKPLQVLKADEEASVTHKDAGGTNFSKTFKLDGSVEAGLYNFSYSVSQDPGISGKMTLTIGEKTFVYPDGDATLPNSGSFVILIAEGDKRVTVDIPGGSPGTFIWTFTISKSDETVLETGKSASVVVPANSDGVKGVAYLETGLYRITLTGDEGKHITLYLDGNTDANIIMESGGDRTATFVISSRGVHTFGFVDAEAQGLTVTVAIEKISVDIMTDGTEKTFTVEPEGSTLTVYLEAGKTFTLNVSGEGYEAVSVTIDDQSVGEQGKITLSEGAATITVTQSKIYTLTFADPSGVGGQELTVSVTEKRV